MIVDAGRSCIVTSASVHDSQVAIPLGTRSAQLVTSLYDLMDSAYDLEEIRLHSQRLGHVPIIDQHPRTRAGKEALNREAKAQRAAGFVPPVRERYKERSTVERVFGHGIAHFLVGFRLLLPRWALKVDIFWQYVELRAECMGANGPVHAYMGPNACSHADFRAQAGSWSDFPGTKSRRYPLIARVSGHLGRVQRLRASGQICGFYLCQRQQRTNCAGALSARCCLCSPLGPADRIPTSPSIPGGGQRLGQLLHVLPTYRLQIRLVLHEYRPAPALTHPR